MKKIAAMLLIGSSLYAAKPSDQLSFFGGVFDIFRDWHRTFEFGGEYKFYPNWRSPVDFLAFRPLLGAMANADLSTYLYGGINFDLSVSDHFVLAPGFAAGWYNKADGKDLGSPLEFRTCLEAAWQFDNFSRLGLRFYHVSNANIGHRNPGEESLVLFYDVPLSELFKNN